MPNWFRKTLVALITVFTFGLVTPPSILLDNAKAADKPTSTAGQQNLESTSYTYEETNDRLTTDTFITYAMLEAEKQSMQKFGTKIGPVIEDEFKDVILPKIEEAIAELASDVPEESLQSLAISQRPAGGNNEKIFHVYDTKSGNDLLRFHVRRDHPPQDGYYFNFHYHRFDDGYSGHHELGNIYWNTNVPPKWLS
ncbi:cell division protein FtsK [Bacillus cereus]|uniref:Cell division protein FtsK n=2 Tax=Bacillus cereus group TaxID=86661 RepID=A0A9X6VLZ4_BACCE|nr:MULTISPECIES: YpjP family protein [Bacillus cereus group]MCH4566443.1 YpjP family protein [Bacillus sp. ES1-5]MCU5377256.1 YpjP family protein [Bacillus cereus]MDA1676154.1 YpjP family protein [Bacillus cereus group sp. TH152-1LC]MED2185901.1 YpjP family protein [Bacillus wiedmannii]PEJ04381.1 cell division protein FtsK [Bacillus wiedmannii]